MNTLTSALLTDQVVFAESPRWHDGRLWFSDVHDYHVKTVDLDGHIEVVVAAPGRPAGLGFLPDGTPLLATAKDRMIWTIQDGELIAAWDLSGIVTGLLNDMVVDARGYAYVGDTGFVWGAGVEPRPGRVILLVPGQAPRIVAEGVEFPNGCAVSADGETYYVNETNGKRLSAFTITPDGSLTGRRVMAQFDDSPDGLCLERGGGAWVGLFTAEKFVRIDADGHQMAEIQVPGHLAVAAVLGGPGRDQLFLTSAETTLAHLAQGISRGRISIAPAPEPGVGSP